jgi:DNA primase
VRNLDIFISEGVNVYITTLEKGYDPDSFIRKFGAEEFEACVKRAKNLFDYKMDLLRERHDARDTRGKVNIANEMLPTIARITNEVMKSALIKRLAEELSVDEASLKAELKKVRPDYAARAVGQPAAKQKDESDTFRSAEKLVLALMLEEGRFIDSVKASLAAEDFRDEAIRKIVSAIFSFHGEGKAVSAGRLINHLNDERASGIISEVATLQGVVSDRERALADCIDRMKKEKIGDELSRLQVEIKDAYLSQDERRWKELAMKYNDLVKLQKAKRQAA